MSKTKLIKKGAKAPTTKETMSLHVRSFSAKAHDNLRTLAFKMDATHADVLDQALKALKKSLK
jgi:hypothetical protein